MVCLNQLEPLTVSEIFSREVARLFYFSAVLSRDLMTSFGRLVFTIDPRSELGIWILNPNSQHTILCVLIRLGHQCPVWSGYLIA